MAEDEAGRNWLKGHGTEACARRERRAGRKPCARCLAAESAAGLIRTQRRRKRIREQARGLEG